MPSKSKAQQKFMGMVYGLKKGEVSPSDVSTKVKKAAGSISKSDAEDFASTKHKGKPEHVKKETMVRELIRKLVREIMSEMNEEVNEAKKRDYKAEYKKFQSSDKSKKYRAELNAYNRKKGTYGNGDGKDASHKGGKIAGFEKESVNRGRAEKSRLKKEGINVRKWVNAVNKGKDVVVYDKKGKRYNLQGGDNKSVQVTDHWEDAGRRNVHPEKTWQTLPLSKVKKIVTEGKLNEIATDVLLGQFGFDEVDMDSGVIFYKNKKAKLDAWYDGRKAMVGRTNGKDNKVFKDGDNRLETYLRKKFKLKSRWDEGKLNEEKYVVSYLNRIATYNTKNMSDAKKQFVSDFTIPMTKWKYVTIMTKKDFDHIQWRGKKNPLEGKLTEAKKETILHVALRVLKNRSAEKYKSKKGMVMIDLQSANLLVQVFKKVGDKMKKILLELGYSNPKQLMNMLWTVAKAG